MIKLQGTLINYIEKTTYKGDNNIETPVKAKLQILVENKRASGALVKQLFTVSIPDEKIPTYKEKIGKEVSVDVGIISKSYSFYGV